MAWRQQYCRTVVIFSCSRICLIMNSTGWEDLRGKTQSPPPHTPPHNFSIEETKRKNTVVTHSKDLNGGHHYTHSACRDVSGLGQTLQVNENGSAMRQLDILLSCCIEGLFALNVHPTTVEN